MVHACTCNVPNSKDSMSVVKIMMMLLNFINKGLKVNMGLKEVLTDQEDPEQEDA